MFCDGSIRTEPIFTDIAIRLLTWYIIRSTPLSRLLPKIQKNVDFKERRKTPIRFILIRSFENSQSLLLRAVDHLVKAHTSRIPY